MNARRRVTITDVARAAGVSVATVSKVVNGRYGVAATTADRVRTVIDELGYSSSLVARSLRSTHTGVIGILVAEFEPFSTEVLKGLGAAAVGNAWQWTFTSLGLGIVMGIIAGMTGLGGGALMVPALVLLFKFPMLRAVATSSAAIIFTAPGGIIGYILNGLDVPGRLPYSVGYVNLAIWLALIVLSVPMAQLGAKTAHSIDGRKLRIIFVVLMVYVGLRMTGLFESIGL